MGKFSRDKGKRGERELAGILTRLFGVFCRRGQQYSGIEGRDVVGLKGVHIECKRTERLRLREALQQATEDASEGETPIVCHKQNGEEWLATVALNNLPDLVSKLFLQLAAEA
ncbi:hypothetical protein [Gimesia fumaroli]|uniref:Holliday junction resolvase n=1 Tax=Gimesia fumaroli TaxID=2527976 RepID=A0A518IKV7_9PLAN|nr:hypothetical protein [Gimesia fumaroli]QDV53717.1 hypothetical protein Enr17x_57980 [Gimesia fumaroli]